MRFLIPQGDKMTPLDKKQAEAYMKRFPLPDVFSFDITPYLEVVCFETDDMIMREGERPSALYFFDRGPGKTFSNP